MTPSDQLKQAAARLDNLHGKGGKTRLARLLDWNYATLWRKLNGKSKVTHSDLMAARAATAKASRGRSGAA